MSSSLKCCAISPILLISQVIPLFYASSFCSFPIIYEISVESSMRPRLRLSFSGRISSSFSCSAPPAMWVLASAGPAICSFCQYVMHWIEGSGQRGRPLKPYHDACSAHSYQWVKLKRLYRVTCPCAMNPSPCSCAPGPPSPRQILVCLAHFQVQHRAASSQGAVKLAMQHAAFSSGPRLSEMGN